MWQAHDALRPGRFLAASSFATSVFDILTFGVVYACLSFAQGSFINTRSARSLRRVTNDAPAALEPQALILTVTSDANSGPGTLRSAISQAVSGDTITFADNVRTITLASTLIIDKSLSISGQGRVTVSGGTIVQVMHVSSGVTLNLDGITIANGSAFNLEDPRGGGIYNRGSLTVTNSTFRDNSSFRGGGGIFNSGTLTVTNSTFSSNSGESIGGGIFNLGGNAFVTNSTFSGNSAYEGGGIFNHGNLTVTNSTLVRNSASSNGGGIYTAFALNLTNSIVALNTAPTGPDIFFRENHLSASHNLIGNPDGGSGITDGVNGNIVNDDPKLGSLADNGGPTRRWLCLP
jgi:predicted outer membrane repeat protein